MASNPLQQLGEHGQSIWLDFISRDLLTTGRLRRLIADSNVTGLTSNPTIFEKAIGEGTDYDAQLRQLLDSGITAPDDLFFGVAITDIQQAADALRDVYDATEAADGYVSLEVAPAVAHDTEATVAMARSLWQQVDRRNLMVKVPATPEGIPAIQRLIADGININVTLIFALSAYDQVIDAYLSGLEQRVAAGQALDVHSVASFFVSRVDTAVDPLLEERMRRDPGSAVVEGLFGKAAIANARLAYELFESTFRGGDRFAALAAAGASVQRPLWASTSAKNPNYRDVLYAEALVGPDTVDTMPPAVIEAFRDHGIVGEPTAGADYPGARRVIEELASVGINLDDVTEGLLVAGVASFAASYDKLIRVIEEQVDQMRGGLAGRTLLDLGAYADAVARALAQPASRELARRIWARDADVWKPGNADHARVIANRLGWLDVITVMQERLPEFLKLADDALQADIDDVVLLGMGGSSLAPEVLRSSFGSAAGSPALHVLDTTDPAAVNAMSNAINPRRTWFVVASKSGGTVETLSHMAHFWDLVVSAGAAEPGRQFICVTDPGSSLADHARAHKFRNVFENPADIGGRYSALSYFGLVPAAIMGIDVERLLGRAAAMHGACGPDVPSDLNPGAILGTVLTHLREAGRDKVTILAPPRIAAYSLWAEQLIAESTGKEGKGIVPVGEEPIGEPAVYGGDRLFVLLTLDDAPDPAFDRQAGALRASGAPVVAIRLADLYDLGGEFFRWEYAVAVASASLQIDPFDEPNVKESKDNTARLLAAHERDGGLPAGAPAGTAGAITVDSDPGAGVADAITAFLRASDDGDYIALQAYVTPTEENHQALQALRVAIRNRWLRATTLGFGPRFLHSTGQLHKGGPNTGVFVQIVSRDTVDAGIPGQPYTFSILKQAQALGDLESLRGHHRRVIRLDVADNLAHGLAALTEAIRNPAGAAR